MTKDALAPAAADHRTRVSDRVADRILARIASGEWAVGQRLPGERQLAEDMGVSRVSVRAALQTLKTQGLLDAVQGGGTRVVANAACMDASLAQLVKANHETLADLAEIRGQIEVWAARRAAANATPANLAELAEVMASTEADINAGKHKTENDIRFHLAVAKASGSTVYMHVMGVFRGILQQMLDYHRYEMFPTAADDQTILSHHRAIYDAIVAGDADAAAAAMQAHLGWVVARYRTVQNRRSGAEI
ncbi:FadR/GntR family transcriptional regulator [Magnetospirillum sulfuroxidans]|uniref:Pyruvate dehydrogenase complex repressor n=1 Tax=Magnetospirillum sulfuroxidans TaxID=611300 RepID=A0ABS5IEV1_9PROT|nr:FCD domain-containing protein [Magnetospirillum sulfuroxidans]MBR9972293.1 FadR family transcriptional regulator [Magnetospirillum sulfuroxidans]